MKRCSRCGETKELSEFYKNGKGELSSYCKLCALAYKREHYKTHGGKNDAKRRRERLQHLKRTFNLSTEEYEKLFQAQGGVCACCRNAETAIDPRSKALRKLAIDHCHATGKVRALLCAACNTAFGLLNEDPVRIEALLRYAQAQRTMTAPLEEN